MKIMKIDSRLSQWRPKTHTTATTTHPHVHIATLNYEYVTTTIKALARLGNK